MSDNDSNGDGDSLFGSPPSSPLLLRGTSPTLALPGSSGTSNVVPKNVGTIALPGSHNSSEHVVSLPASPPRSRIAYFAPEQPRPALLHSYSDLTSGRAASLSAGPRRQVKTPKKAKSVTPTPVASGPPFSLPEANEPLPPNFLRNQQALLGLAGVVGGINPAHLSTRSSRGTTAQNPIVVEEEAPSISSSAWKARQPRLPAHLPLPDADSVADTLVSQGNIFPVIRSLLPYFGTNANVGCCSNHNSHYAPAYSTPAAHPELVAPPLKRRRLNSVPAGAGDWDVPYPFPDDEGPRHYYQDWEKNRGKRLAAQLVSLVRDAVKKAAAKSHLQEVAKDEGKSPNFSLTVDSVDLPTNGHENDMAASQYPRNQPQFLQGGSNFESFSSQKGVPELLASGHDIATQSFDPNLGALLGAVNDALIDSNMRLTDDELAAISSFGYIPAMSNSPTLTSSTRFPTPCDLSRPSTAENKENFNLGPAFSQTQDFNFNIDNVPIDPMLLDMSWPSSIDTGNPASASSTADRFSPSAAEQPYTQHHSNTPTSSSENIYTHDDQTDFLRNAMEGVTSSSRFPATSSEILGSSSTFGCSPTGLFAASTSSQAHPQGVRFLPPVIDDMVRTRGGRSGSKKLDREDVLRRARVRREQLAAEIASAKIELWETTIEQGVLINLSKDKSLLS
ncbi:hypothetical protein M0805_002383 [Coniferiporia weirii]|nr:hypothetical protein M0805_002383 [Coniferiporia weirii]